MVVPLSVRHGWQRSCSASRRTVWPADLRWAQSSVQAEWAVFAAYGLSEY